MSDSNLEKIGSLWKKESKKGTPYLRGEIDGQKVMIFKAREKRSDKSPDYAVYRDNSTVSANASAPAPAPSLITDDDIPF